jgi:hypothetical protein
VSALEAAVRAADSAPAADLAREADRIHRILFGTAASEELKRRYAAAIASVPADVTQNGALVFKPGANLEAIEFALRRINAFNPLTQRFRVVSYLAEIEPAHFTHFITERRRFWAGAGALVRAAVRAFCLRFKGARHALG